LARQRLLESNKRCRTTLMGFIIVIWARNTGSGGGAKSFIPRKEEKKRCRTWPNSRFRELKARERRRNQDSRQEEKTGEKCVPPPGGLIFMVASGL